MFLYVHLPGGGGGATRVLVFERTRILKHTPKRMDGHRKKTQNE